MSEALPRTEEEQEIATDARSERRLVWQALLSLAVVVVVVIVRELLL
ncbi:hypothetical protein [Microbacterium hydrocarbonoxydans]|nr:hypothetical protein [Microbacterium hydrocarbonoxydans]MCM3779611.1 hypothetical protein [Microbacterium hydrocarbonoxydans]